MYDSVRSTIARSALRSWYGGAPTGAVYSDPNLICKQSIRPRFVKVCYTFVKHGTVRERRGRVSYRPRPDIMRFPAPWGDETVIRPCDIFAILLPRPDPGMLNAIITMPLSGENKEPSSLTPPLSRLPSPTGRGDGGEDNCRDSPSPTRERGWG